VRWVRRGGASLVALGLLGVPANPASAGPAPAFEPGPCPAVVPDDPRVECGTLTVPENRRLSAGEIVLSVARIRPATAEIGAPPLLYASGGPGDSSLVYATERLEQPIVEDRELVLVDLRGTGTSLPSLACPEAQGPAFTFSAPTDDRVAAQAELDGLARCKRRLERDGVDLRSYDYEESAADLADLRVALGIDEWDVYGISDGGRLALELVRRHPDGVRSLVLDSPVAPQRNVFADWPYAARAFDVLFDACAADQACNTAHPDLEDRFWDLIPRLRDDPVVQQATTPDGAQGTVAFDDRNTLDILRAGLYDTALLPAIPSLIDLLTNGQGFDVVATEVLARTFDDLDTFSAGAGLSDSCREEVPFVRRKDLARRAREVPRFRRVILDDMFRKECKVWDVGRADATVNRPVRSKVPALLLAGEFDPVAPVDSSRAIAKHLPNSTVAEFPGIGHGTQSAHECPRSILRAFLLDPTGQVDTSCVAGMGPPAFG
jgi:pimeloyl-ACP methyl ester carboxylesterase